MEFFEKTMKTDRVYEGRILNLRVDTVELPNKMYSKREIIEHKPAVVIIPILDKDTVVMIKQYRKAVDKTILEFPAGLIDNGETPEQAAERELQEEIGYSSKKFNYLYDFFSSPGFTDEKVSMFLATDLFESKLEADDDEFLNIELVKIDDLVDMLNNYELNDVKTIVATQYLIINREKLNAK